MYLQKVVDRKRIMRYPCGMMCSDISHLDMSTGELDLAVAELVMGYVWMRRTDIKDVNVHLFHPDVDKRWPHEPTERPPNEVLKWHGHGRFLDEWPHGKSAFSFNLSAAMKIIERLLPIPDSGVEISASGTLWCVLFSPAAFDWTMPRTSESLPEAICRAALDFTANRRI